jgi:predicted short-subunit dehydrogenase-like oxidoreductase (DUF2520 family)
MKISIIGSGNVATHLAIAIHNAGEQIVQVFSKNIRNAETLAKKINTKHFTDKFDNIEEADLYIISVSDTAIKQIAAEQKLRKKFLVHTSGSVEMKIFQEYTDNYGVFYPLQTFKKEQKINMQEVPICLEASDKKKLDILQNLSKKISNKIYFIDSHQRKKLHLSAVFVNNFVNHLFAIAAEIIEKEGLNFEILKPLIQKTFENIENNKPSEIQTGPAVRADMEVIRKHIEMLKNYNHNYSEIYKIISESIMTTPQLKTQQTNNQSIK